MVYPASDLSHENILRDVHDATTQTLRTTATAIIAPGLDVDISHTDDSVRLGDGTSFLTSTTVGSDVGLDVNLINNSLDVNIVSQGNINNIYNEITSVASGSSTLIISHTVTTAGNLKQVDVSGTNVAEYIVYLNSAIISKKRTYFSGGLNSSFMFDNGITLSISDLVEVEVLHNRPMSGDFNSNIIILED